MKYSFEGIAEKIPGSTTYIEVDGILVTTDSNSKFLLKNGHKYKIVIEDLTEFENAIKGLKFFIPSISYLQDEGMIINTRC